MLVVYHHSFLALRGTLHGAARFAAGHLDDILGGGVEVFFVLSQFVITLAGPLAPSRLSSAQLLWR